MVIKKNWSAHFTNRQGDFIFISHEKRPKLVSRKGVVFHYDNAKPDTPLRQKLWQWGRVVLRHPPYSPATAASDFHLFRYLHKSLNSHDIDNEENIKRHL